MYRRNLFQKWTRCLAGNIEKMVMGIKSRDSTQINDVEILKRHELLGMCQVIYFDSIFMLVMSIEPNKLILQELYVQEKRKLWGNSSNDEFSPHPQQKICVDFLDKFLTYVRKTLTTDTAFDEVYRFKVRPAETAGSIRVERITGKQSAAYQFMDLQFREWLKK